MLSEVRIKTTDSVGNILGSPQGPSGLRLSQALSTIVTTGNSARKVLWVWAQAWGNTVNTPGTPITCVRNKAASGAYSAAPDQETYFSGAAEATSRSYSLACQGNRTTPR